MHFDHLPRRAYRSLVEGLPVVLRTLGLTVFAEFGAIASLSFLLVVPQGSEILLAFDQATLLGRSRELYRGGELGWLLVGVLALGLSCWYTSRLILGSRFPDDPPVAPRALGLAAALQAWWPRLLGAACVLPIGFAHAWYSAGAARDGAVTWMLALQVALALLAWRERGGAAGPPWPLVAWCALLACAAVGALARGAAPPAWWDVPGTPLLALATAALALAWARWPGVVAARSALAIYALALTILLVVRVPASAVGMLFFAAANLMLWLVVRRRALFRRYLPALARDAAQKTEQVGRVSIVVLGVTLAASYGLLALFATIPVRAGTELGAPAVIAFALASVVQFGAALFVLLPKRCGLPSLALVPLVLALAIPSIDNHAIRGGSYRHAARPTVAEHFPGWRAALPDRPGQPLFVVATSGGGLRAAYWTAMLLAELDDRSCGAFGRRTYALSAVSGGALGAGVFVAVLRDRGPTPRCDPAGGGTLAPDRIAPRVAAMLAADFLGPTTGALLFTDLLQRFVPVPLFRDRAATLETSWEQRWASLFASRPFEAPFDALYDDGSDRILPSLLLNSTLVEQGRRIVGSNLRFKPADGYDLFDDPLRTGGIRLSTAIHDSARFTYLSPAGTLYGHASPAAAAAGAETLVGRVVDGGYFENSGAATARELIDAVHDVEPSATLVPLIITNDPDDLRLCAHGGPAAGPLAPLRLPWLAQLAAPLEALLDARGARGSLARAELLRQARSAPPDCIGAVEAALSDLPGALDVAGPSPDDCVDDPRHAAPLGWYLSNRSRCVIARSARAFAFAVRLPGLP